MLRLCQRLLPYKPEATEPLLRGLQLVPGLAPEVGGAAFVWGFGRQGAFSGVAVCLGGARLRFSPFLFVCAGGDGAPLKGLAAGAGPGARGAGGGELPTCHAPRRLLSGFWSVRNPGTLHCVLFFSVAALVDSLGLYRGVLQPDPHHPGIPRPAGG